MVNGDGEQTRDFIFVGDVARANIHALEENMHGIFNVSSGEQSTINNLAEIINELTGKKSNITHSEEIKGELRKSCLDNEKLKETGWIQKINFEEGLKLTVDYFNASS